LYFLRAVNQSQKHITTRSTTKVPLTTATLHSSVVQKYYWIVSKDKWVTKQLAVDSLTEGKVNAVND
jgi:hypothetical protein